jgi:hypothetical protein
MRGEMCIDQSLSGIVFDMGWPLTKSNLEGHDFDLLVVLGAGTGLIRC